MTYNSQRVSDGERRGNLYRYLRSSNILETDKITSELHLHQDGKVVKVEKEAALLHIYENDSGLEVYVPMDEIHQETCFRSKLPRRLCEWLMTDPDTQIFDPVSPQAEMAVQSVLGARPRALPAILDEQGILPIDLECEVEISEDVGGTFCPPQIPSQRLLDEDKAPSWKPTSVDMAVYTPPSPALTPYCPGSLGSGEPIFRPRNRDYPSPSRFLPICSSFEPPALSGYAQLLRKVVGQARQGVFPARGGAFYIPGNQPEHTGFESSDTYGLHVFDKLERDIKVGAAGELFVSVSAC